MHHDCNLNDQECISNSQVGSCSEHAKWYCEHNSECIRFPMHVHVNWLSLFIWNHSIIFWGEWKWAYIFLIGQKLANKKLWLKHVRMHATWLAEIGLTCPIKKNPNIPNDKLFLTWFPRQQTKFFFKIYIGSRFQWSLYCFFAAYYLYIPPEKKGNW